MTCVTVMRDDPPRLRAEALPFQFEGRILVPEPSVNSYKAAEGWRNFADRIGPIAGVGSGLVILFY